MFENLFQKLYTEAWDEEKTMFYPYSDSPELRRVAKAQQVLSDVRTILHIHTVTSFFSNMIRYTHIPC